VRRESLHLYYEHNIFECWRPRYWLRDWTTSILAEWLFALDEKTLWLRSLVLLYKQDSELEHDLEDALAQAGFKFHPEAVSNKKELSEYETVFEDFGLPRHFGRSRAQPRWTASAGGG
jgi:hypothetical protein